MTQTSNTNRGRHLARRWIGWAWTGLALLLLSMPLASCRQEGPAEQAGKKIDEAVEATKDTAADAAEKAKDVAADVKDAATDAAKDVKENAEEAKEEAKDKMY
jgi:hypothetical protein